MGIKSVICAVLLTHYVLILSMSTGGQLVDVDIEQYLIDPLKEHIASQMNGFKSTISNDILKCINNRIGQDKTISWNNVVSDLDKLERHQTFPSMFAAGLFGMNVVNMAFFAYPALNRMFNLNGTDISSGFDPHKGTQVCLAEPMNRFVPVIETINIVQFFCSLVVFLKSMEVYGFGCPTFQKHSSVLRNYLKGKQTVQVSDLKEFIKNKTSSSINNIPLFDNAAQFAKRSDGMVDVAMFKKFLSRSYARSDEARYLTSLAFLLNLIFAFPCAPELTRTGGASDYHLTPGSFVLGIIVLALNFSTLVNHALFPFPRANKKDLTDIRAVRNMIQSHLEQKSANDV